MTNWSFTASPCAFASWNKLIDAMCDVILHLNCGCDFCCDYLNFFDAIFCVGIFDFSSNLEFSYFTYRHVRAKTAQVIFWTRFFEKYRSIDVFASYAPVS